MCSNDVRERLEMAASGVCPDCGGAMEIDPACVIEVPWVDPYYGRIDRRKKVAPAALCNACETCLELPKEMLR